MDYILEYWLNNPYVQHVTNLDDLGQPYSCEQWSDLSSVSPLIIDDGLTENNLFEMFNFQDAYPSHILVDHNMTVFYKENSISTWLANQSIQDMLDNCGELCSLDTSAADINLDGNINILDIIELANIILYYDSVGIGDINNDGIVNILDIIIIVNIILNP